MNQPRDIEAAKTIGVLGAGLMGAGIAQLAAQSGARTLLFDPVPEALEQGPERIGEALQRRVEKGKLEQAEADAVLARLEPTGELADLGECELVIEAAPERFELKRELLASLGEHVGAECVIATNTSSLSVTELAAAVEAPARVVGLHFFNPPAAMRLVELVAGAESAPEALAVARATGEAMGKRVIDAADIAGFLVNRCNRPYSLESLRLLEQRIADTATIDKVMRLGAGFRMGPFELMDLVGLETNHAVAESLYRQSFGEPRYQPSALQTQMIAAGRLGRKSGRGWYEYGEGEHRAADPEPPQQGGGEGRPLVVLGSLPIAAELRVAAEGARWEVLDGAGKGEIEGAAEPWLVLDCSLSPAAAHAAPTALLLARGSLHQRDPEAAGFHVLPPLDAAKLIEVTATPHTSELARERLTEFVASIGKLVQPVDDAPGLVSGRVVCQLINEAAFLIGEGNGTPADVDAGMELGVNHPRGPVAWSAAIGLEHVIAVLDALHEELGAERYRVAPLLRQAVALGVGLDA